MSSPSLTSKRLEFDDAAEAIEHYFAAGWTDGLPVVPPTASRVMEFLDSAGRSPSEIVGVEPTKGRVITAEKVAVNAVMAGCLPEYLPVVLAAIEAMTEDRYGLHGPSVSTQGAAPLTVVSGPIARELGINSGVGVFGPGHRANATIGRAIRLIVSNVTGAVTGELDKATLGHGGKYSWCIAEAEDVSPWEPLHVERGLDAEQSAVTVFAALAPDQAMNHTGNGPVPILESVADTMLSAGPPNQSEVIVVLGPEHIGYIGAAGWSKREVKEFLYQAARRKASEWAKADALLDSADPDEEVGVAKSPDAVTVLVAGGAAGGFSAVIPLWGGGDKSQSVTRVIRR